MSKHEVTSQDIKAAENLMTSEQKSQTSNRENQLALEKQIKYDKDALRKLFRLEQSKGHTKGIILEEDGTFTEVMNLESWPQAIPLNNEEEFLNVVLSDKNKDWLYKNWLREQAEQRGIAEVLRRLPNNLVADWINGGDSGGVHRLYRFDEGHNGGVIVENGDTAFVFNSSQDLEKRWEDLKREIDEMLHQSEKHSAAHQYALLHKVSQDEAERALYGDTLNAIDAELGERGRLDRIAKETNEQ